MKCDDFMASFMNALDKHAPVKKKTLRGNNAPFMYKPIQSFYARSKLKFILHKNRYNTR